MTNFQQVCIIYFKRDFHLGEAFVQGQDWDLITVRNYTLLDMYNMINKYNCESRFIFPVEGGQINKNSELK